MLSVWLSGDRAAAWCHSSSSACVVGRQRRLLEREREWTNLRQAIGALRLTGAFAADALLSVPCFRESSTLPFRSPLKLSLQPPELRLRLSAVRLGLASSSSSISAMTCDRDRDRDTPASRCGSGPARGLAKRRQEHVRGARVGWILLGAGFSEWAQIVRRSKACNLGHQSGWRQCHWTIRDGCLLSTERVRYGGWPPVGVSEWR